MEDQDLLRYSRQILLPDVDIVGQQALAKAHVLLVGLGGLGSPAALYLAGAGVGELTVVDDDTVEVSNLPRQILFDTLSIGHNKACAAEQRLRALNPQIRINALTERLDGADMAKRVGAANVVLDATDNLASRHALSQACRDARIPLVSGAAIRMEGQLVVFRYDKHHQPCYRCLHPDDQAEERCAESGVLGPVVGVVGTLQALEALRIICGMGAGLQSRLMIFDARFMEWQTLNMTARPDCPVCGAGDRDPC